MSGYLKYFKTEIVMGFQYKAAAISGFFTQVFWGILYCLLYQAFYSYIVIDSISYKELINYVWLMQSFLVLLNIRASNGSLLKSIKDGTVAYELCRPYDLYNWWYIKIISIKYSGLILRGIPIILLSILLPAPFTLTLPVSLEAFILFIISLFIGSLLIVSVVMIMYSITFYTLDNKGISSIICSISDLLSGIGIPVPLLPSIIVTLTYFLPFRLMSDAPFRIYSGNIGIIEARYTIMLQIIWLIILIILGKILIKRALKKICIQGG